MIKYSNILCLLIVISFISLVLSQNKEDNSSNNVIEITPKSFYDLVKKFGRVFLYFYSHKCGHCKTFNPIFDELAKFSRSANHTIGYVKIDGPENEAFADSFRMTETPSLYFVEKVDGVLLKTKYSGRRSLRALTRYITKKNKYRPRQLNDYDAFTKLVKNTKRFLILLGDKSKNEKIFDRFINSALDHSIENIFWSNSDQFYEKYKVAKGEFEVVFHQNVNSTLTDGLLFNVPNLKQKGYRLNAKNIHHLVLVHSKNAVNQFDSEGLQGINLGENPLCLAVYDSMNAPYMEPLQKELEKVALRYRVDCHFFIAQYKSKETSTFTAPLGITKNDLPSFVIFTQDGQEEELNKYIRKSVKGKFEEGDFEKFYENFRAGKIPKHIMSEPIPKHPVDHHGVYKLVGHTFKDVIENKAAGKHVILNIFSDSKRCHLWELRYSRVVKKLKQNDNLFFAKIDLRKNDFEHVNIGLTPTIAFIYDGINRFENFRIFDGNFTTKSLIEFIEKQIKIKDKNFKLKIEALPDDKDNDEKEKYSPIRPKQEAEDEEVPDPEEIEMQDKMKEVWAGEHGRGSEDGEKVDLDDKPSDEEHNDHIKEGL